MQYASLMACAALFMVGAYMLFRKDHLIKKVLGLVFISDSVNLTLISMSYNEGGVVPFNLPGVLGPGGAGSMGYPLPMAMVLTNIVIAVATVGLMAALMIKIYRREGSLSASRIWDDE
jgi:multisubunit Na+/H+ antiporter MnhC subunit